ncbi:sulfatase [uncultured Jannaschia sp.]|uniref:sulfatase n=1 Tax=uncultured Jannaschia sp. TaxID=293347 RepID=UPI00261BF2A1|nr:sulfatase [uncultured Jannaschia sp.]
MRTIFVLFDSLNRLALGAYGGTAIATPNFDRFAARSMVFDRHYVGSLPCMPARRDMHTGRLNFLHRSWGPLEPFDNSYARILSQAGTYTHIVSDHLHYFEEGGAGYVNAFDSWHFVRGQEYDPLKVMVKPPVDRLRERFDPRHYPLGDVPKDRPVTRGTTSETAWRRSRGALNALFLEDEADWPTSKCFEAAFDFLDTNRETDGWMLQLECFDPHEPFNAPQRYRDAYQVGRGPKILDWPVYETVTNSAEEIAEIRGNYAALVAMCDARFGELLDWLDRENAWDDTCVILTTDHGFLLGEHDWWGKNKMPYYEEIAHIPLMIAHPEGRTGRHDGLTQTTDLMPTLLELHGAQIPDEVRAHSLLPALRGENVGRDSAILGMFAGPLCITDGDWTYYLYPRSETAEALAHYTLAPSHLDRSFSPEELASASLSPPMPFTKGVPVLRVDARPPIGEAGFEAAARRPAASPLYDLTRDPGQEMPVDDPETKARLELLAVHHLVAHDAPVEIFKHYGLFDSADHALVAAD